MIIFFILIAVGFVGLLVVLGSYVSENKELKSAAVEQKIELSRLDGRISEYRATFDRQVSLIKDLRAEKDLVPEFKLEANSVSGEFRITHGGVPRIKLVVIGSHFREQFDGWLQEPAVETLDLEGAREFLCWLYATKAEEIIDAALENATAGHWTTAHNTWVGS